MIFRVSRISLSVTSLSLIHITHVLKFPVFLRINDILLYAYGTCGLPIHLSVNMDVASIFVASTVNDVTTHVCVCGGGVLFKSQCTSHSE